MMSVTSTLELVRSSRTAGSPLRLALTGLAAAVTALALGGVQSASAASFPDEVSGPRVEVEYTSKARAPADPASISDADARTAVLNAERALDQIVGRLGFPAPLPGRDGKINIYVYVLKGEQHERGAVARPLSSQPGPQPGYVGIEPSVVSGPGKGRRAITHELVHLAQFAVSVHSARLLSEGIATWSGRLFANDDPQPKADPSYDGEVPLDCAVYSECEAPGYAAWTFWEFLGERYGLRIGREAYDRLAALQVARRPATPIDAIDAALRARGASFTEGFRNFGLANLVGAYTHPDLRNVESIGETGLGREVSTGKRSRRLATRRFRVRRLGMEFLDLVGSGKGRRCRRAKLTLSISAPRADAFVGYSKAESPSFALRKARPLKLRGGKGRLSVRWSTCPRSRLGLVFIHAGRTSDNAKFGVSPRIRVARR